MLTPERLVEALQAEFGDRPLDPFGVPAGGTTAAILCDYWRAIAAVGRLIAKTPGGAPALLERYIAGCHRRAQVG